MLSKMLLAGHLARFREHDEPFRIITRARGVEGLQEIREQKWYTFTWQALSSSGLPEPDSERHTFLLRPSDDRFMLLASHNSAVEAFLRRSRIESLIEYPRIDIPVVVRTLAEGEDERGREYKMGAVFGTVEGQGRPLRTMALWGDDLAGAGIFSDLLALITPYRVSFRDYRSEREVASVGSQGEVSLYFRGVLHLDQTDRLFRYLSKRHLIHWSQ